MTTIAYRDGVLAADSRETSGCEDSGQLAAPCDKLFRVGWFIVALQGETTPGMAWLYWFRQRVRSLTADAEMPHTPADIIDRFLENDADFTAVVLNTADKAVWIYDEWGIPQRITAPYYAVGSGAKVAYGAMHHGASATEAVLAACEHDPYTSFPVHSSENI
jgi:hypothetical protein